VSGQRLRGGAALHSVDPLLQVPNPGRVDPFLWVGEIGKNWKGHPSMFEHLFDYVNVYFESSMRPPGIALSNFFV